AQGGILAAPAWTAMMKEVYDRRPIPAAWPRPDGLAALDIDRTTGYKATPFCPKDFHYIESFIPGTEPTQFCPVHSPFNLGGNAANPMGGAPPPPVAPAAPQTPNPGTMGGTTARPGHPVSQGPGAAAQPNGVMGGSGPPPSSSGPPPSPKKPPR